MATYHYQDSEDLSSSLTDPASSANEPFAGKYTVFGQVIDGMDVLDRMEKVPVGAGDRPVQEIQLNSITIHANPLAS